MAVNFRFVDGGTHSPGKTITQQEEDIKGKLLEQSIQETLREDAKQYSLKENDNSQ